jgi:hypothetical protein
LFSHTVLTRWELGELSSAEIAFWLGLKRSSVTRECPPCFGRSATAALHAPSFVVGQVRVA